MSQRNNSNPVLAIVFIIMLIVGFWMYRQITDFAAFAHLNFDTAATLLRNFVLLIGLLVGSAYLGAFRYVVHYVPAFVVLAMVPALQFWSVDHFITEYYDFALNTEPAWYGRTWVLALVVISLGGAGFWLQNRE